MLNDFDKQFQKLYRLPKVLELIPVSKSTWWQGVKEGRFPKPIKLTPRTSCWLADEIHDLIDEAKGARS